VDDEESVNNAPLSDDFKQRVSPYELLMRQSRKMGGLATRTYDVTKEFLRQDVSVLHPDRVLFGKSSNQTRAHHASNNPPYASDVKSQNGSISLEDADSPEAKAEKSRLEQSDREGGEREAKTLDPREGLRKIVKKSHQLLARYQTVILPMNLFPDSVTVDRTKVTITKRAFFWTSSVISIRIEDVLNVACSTGPIFGSLIISSRVMNSTDHYEIDYFWRKDALYLKQLIQGYVIAQHNQIATSNLNRDDLVKTLLDLGNDSDY
jgi:hypothetical protein